MKLMVEKTDISTRFIAPTLQELQKEQLRQEIKRRIEREQRTSKRNVEDK